MKPIEIKKILDVAKIRQNKGENYVPLFAGEAGLGKSEIAQQWVKDQQKINPEFFFLDLRLAYFEPQDMVGLPMEHKLPNGQIVTTMAPPSMWVMDENAEGLILFEEPNRGMLSTLNAMMQILTDRQINGIKIPKKVVLAAVINPENGSYDVAKMDAALANRFMEFKVEYDHKSFMKYMRDNEYCDTVISWVDSDEWNYVEAEQVGPEGKYISPRSISKLNMIQTSMNEGLLTDSLYFENLVSVLGKPYAKSYYQHVNDNRPILVADILKNKKKALTELKKQSDDKMRTDNVRLTLDSVINAYKTDKIDRDLLLEVFNHITSEDLVFTSIKDVYRFDYEKKNLEEKEFSEYTLKTWLSEAKTNTKNLIQILKTTAKNNEETNNEKA